MHKIYNINKSFFKNLYGTGFIPLIMVYGFYGFIIPVLDGFKHSVSYGLQKFISNQKEVFSYDFLTDFNLWGQFLLFYIACYMSLYYPIRKVSKQVKIFSDRTEITLLNREIINTKYSDVIKIVSDHPEEEINLHLQDCSVVKITNDIVNYAELRDFIFKEVSKRGGEVLVRDESKKD